MSAHAPFEDIYLDNAITMGFDLAKRTEDGLHIGCSQCQALCINGVPCHEHGCPNYIPIKDCFECGFAFRAAGELRYSRVCEDCASPREDA